MGDERGIGGGGGGGIIPIYLFPEVLDRYLVCKFIYLLIKYNLHKR